MKLIINSQKYAVYAFLFSLNFETINLFGLDIDYLATKITISILFITSIFSYKSLLSLKPFSRYIIPLIVYFVLLSIISLINKTQQFNVFFDLPFFLNILIFIILINHSIRRKKILPNGLLVFSIGTFILSVFYFFNFAVTNEIENRYTVFGISPNVLGIITSISLFLLLEQILQNKGKLGSFRYILLIPIPFIFNLMIGTGSRVSIISFILGLFLFLFYNKFLRKGKKIVLILFTIIISSFSWILFFKNSFIMGRLRDSIYSGDLSSRDYIWESIYEIISNNFIWGVGKTGYASKVNYIMGKIVSPHNVLIEVLCYTGIIGLIIFLVFLFRVFKKSMDKRKIDNDIFPLILLIHIFGMILSAQIFETKIVWVVFAYIISNKLYEMKNAFSN